MKTILDRSHFYLCRVTLAMALALMLALTQSARAQGLPMEHGVVFFCPPGASEALANLKKLKADGYNLIEFASWPWTLPQPGSALEKTATAVLTWCDANDVHFFLMQNIQYGSDGGGLDGEWTDPLKMAGCLTDWLRIMAGHRCVAGVITGNEVGPAGGNPKDSPIWWTAFLSDLKARHQTIEKLNAAWKTNFTSFEDVSVPQPGTPGDADYHRFSLQAFDRYYGAIAAKVCKPALGDLLYGPKTSGDPLLQRGCAQLSMICWDDVVADWPQWRVKGMCDVSRATGRPVFNAELHLHHDTYAYGGSPEKARYRYFLSALNGEWMSASFAWGQWDKVAWHTEDHVILSELRRIEPYLRAFSAGSPDVHVLISGAKASDDATLENLYTEMASLGCPWEFVCPQDVGRVRSGAVYVPADTQLAGDVCELLIGLPKNIRIVLAKGDALHDEYGRPLSEAMCKAISARAGAEFGAAHLLPAGAELLTPPYTERVEVGYLAWSPERGHYNYPVIYPRLEARRVACQNGWLIAIINHGPKVTARLPWLRNAARIIDLTADNSPIDPKLDQSFDPFAVRLFQYAR